MLSHTLYFLFLLLLIFRTATAADPPAYSPTDLILLNCGESSNLNDTSHRTWNGDDRSRYAPPNAARISTPSEAASRMDSSVFRVPFEKARIFSSPFTYTFPVSLGPKFLRLYFHPGIYPNFNASQSFFNLTANGFTLLSNFSAFLHSQNLSSPSFIKEFVINVAENQSLNLTFTPNPNSSAFVNGIEIVSMPEKLYFKGDGVAITNAGQLFYLKSDTALENVYRLNVGGSRVEIQDDSGMFRAWTDDALYTNKDLSWTPHAEELPINYTADTPPYSAPPIVYKTSRVLANFSRSIDWHLPVDSGFNYLLRLHFCEFFLEVTKQNDRVFTIAVNNQIEEIQADVIFWTGGRTQVPIYRDYIAFVPNNGRHGKQDLFLSLYPNLQGQPKYISALLNGLEVFKLSDSSGSLAAPNPDPAMATVVPPQTDPGGKKKNGGVYAAVGSVIGVLAVVAVASFFILRQRRRRVKDSSTTTGDKSSWVPLSITSRTTTRTSGSGGPLPSDLCKYFTLDEIKAATNNFDPDFVIGRGGFGNVYKGLIDGGATAVAIKRLNSTSNQGAREFLTEIEMLTKLRHLHLVSLIGYCDEYGEMILVYDYMAHGTLRDHLYNSEKSSLTWSQRLQICLGAAKGLHYLHTGVKNTIIHRDVKSTNILLDEKFVAKVSDFGLSKVGPTSGIHTHVSTAVKGSFGYVDPEYYKRQQLTDKSDVYSFGVVLFEVLCARPPIMPKLPREQVNLAEWGKLNFRKGTVEQIMDPSLDGQIAAESLNKFVETAISCLKDKGFNRPAMSDVVWSLEFALQLQETAVDAEAAAEGGFVAVSPSSWPLIGNSMDEDLFSRSTKTSGMSTSSSEKLRTGDVFSEIMNPEGR